MKPMPANFIDDFPIDLGEEYQPLRRALKRRRGFGLLFVRCSPAQGERLIGKVRKDIPQKTVDVLSLDEPIDNLYEIIDNLPNKDKLDILFIKGLEKSLVDYIKPGIGGEGDYYKEDTVPRILGHLNLQRERFRDDFQICFVFLLPLYALKYFIRRAPDFFDWRSGVWDFPTSSDLVEQEASRILSHINSEYFFLMAAPERKEKIFEIQEILKGSHNKFNTKVALVTALNLYLGINESAKTLSLYKTILQETLGSISQKLALKSSVIVLHGLIFLMVKDFQEALASFDQSLELEPKNSHIWSMRGITLFYLARYEAALASYDKALRLQPDEHYVWLCRGVALSNLERYEEALASYDKAVEIKPDYQSGWSHRGNALSHLGRHEEAIASCDKALDIKSDDHYTWNLRGIVLCHLGRYEEVIANCDKDLEIQPDDYYAWNLRGIVLCHLGRYEEAITSYDKTLEIQPDDHYAWYHRGEALYDLGKFDKAITSYDKALRFKPDDHDAWYNKACCYALQGNVDLAIENLQQAIKLNPDEYREMAKTDSDFDSIREDQRFQALIDG
jgi:tetratricopeptide (TPR) repeat protein